MSFAPRDNHEAQVQFALERGVPAVIGVLGTIKLPYPSGAFDMAHCSRCLIPWGANGENDIYIFIFLLEYILFSVEHCQFVVDLPFLLQYSKAFSFLLKVCLLFPAFRKL